MKLKEIVLEFISGDWGAESKSLKNPCKIRCIRGADFQPLQTNGKLDSAPIRYVAGNSLSTKKLKKGDIVIEKSGGSPTQSTGRALYVSDAMIEGGGDIMCSNFCVAIRVNSIWNSKYFYYFWTYLYSLGVFFNFESKTSGIKNLQLDSVLSSIEFPSVPLEQQKKVVSILNGIEEKILLNRRINRNLEAMAHQIYEYWFTQFNFPDENGRPYKSSGGKMLWNERLKRYVPEGWRICKIKDFLKNDYTGDWGFDTPNDDRIQVSCIRGADIAKLNNLPVRYIKVANKHKLLRPFDLVVEVSGGSPTQATGRVAYITPGIIKRNGGKVTCSNFCHSFSMEKIEFSAFFFFLWTQLYENGIMFNFEGKTSGIKNFMTESFLSNEWYFPSTNIMALFFEKISRIYGQIDSNIAEINQLIKMKDLLLPMLMNGQISLNQQEKNCDLSRDL